MATEQPSTADLNPDTTPHPVADPAAGEMSVVELVQMLDKRSSARTETWLQAEQVGPSQSSGWLTP
jgi:hypothetical protein